MSNAHAHADGPKAQARSPQGPHPCQWLVGQQGCQTLALSALTHTHRPPSQSEQACPVRQLQHQPQLCFAIQFGHKARLDYSSPDPHGLGCALGGVLWLSESSISLSRVCASLMVEPSLAYIHVEPRGLPAHVSRPPVAVIRTRSMTQQNKQSATIVWHQRRSFGEQDHHLHSWTDLSMCRFTLIEPDCNALCRITGHRDTLITQRCSRHIPLDHTGLLIWPRAYPSRGRKMCASLRCHQ